MNNHYVFASMFGVSDLMIERAGRLLAYEIGRRRDGTAVSVRSMLAGENLDPDDLARLLMLIDPLEAVARLTRLVERFAIDGEPADDPAAVARNALAHAGRVVTMDELHPEFGWLRRMVAALRRWRP